MFLDTCLFLLGCQIFDIHFFFFGISAVSIVLSPFSFFILFIWFLSLFIVSLARYLSILFLLSKNQHLVLLIFFCWFFYIFVCLFYLLSDLYYFLLSSEFRFCLFIYLFIFDSFKWYVRLRFFFFFLLRKACVAINFPLRTAFAASHRYFYGCVFIVIFLKMTLVF